MMGCLNTWADSMGMFIYYSIFTFGLVTEMDDCDVGVHSFLSARLFLTISSHNNRPTPCLHRVPGPLKSAGCVFLNVCVYMWCLFCVIKCVIVKRDVF